MCRFRFVMLFAFVIAILFFFLTGIHDCLFHKDFIFPDAYSYMEASARFYEECKADPLRALGFPVFIGLPYLFGSTMTTEHFVMSGIPINLFCWIGASCFFFATLKLLFGPRASFWITFASLFTIGAVGEIFQVMTEPLTTLLLSVIFYFIFKFQVRGKLHDLIPVAATMNFLVLVRPGFIYLGIAFSVCLVVSWIVKKQRWHYRHLFFLLTIVLIVSQLSIMKRDYGKYTISFIDKITWYYYLGAQSQASLIGTDYFSERDKRYANLENKPYTEISKISSSDLTNQVKGNLPNVLKNYFSNLIENAKTGSTVLIYLRDVQKEKSNSFSTFLFYLSKLQNIFYTLLFLSSLVILVAKRIKPDFSVSMLIGVILYVVLTSGISAYQGDRFQYVLYPMISLLFLALITKKENIRKVLEK